METATHNGETHTWPDFALALYDKLTGRGALVSYDFQNLEVYVPSSHSTDAAQAKWKLNGKLVISTTDRKA